MPHIILAFSSAASIEYNVAGIPAGARAVHALAALGSGDDVDHCSLTAGTAWSPSSHMTGECQRLAPEMQLSFSLAAWPTNATVVRGEAFVAALARQHGRWNRDTVLLALADARIRRPIIGPTASDHASLRQLDRAGRLILAATGKAGDGIVSRHVNRPVSRAISQQLLRFPRIRPCHASAGTALLGLAMVIALLLGGHAGLIAGALLFQTASIFDGVDGEMARATYRTSKEGASLDSVIDACTNLAFVMGVTVNVGLSGDIVGATAGAASLLILAIGLTLLGRRARNTGQAVNFDVVKTQLRKDGKRSTMTECLIHLTMRDFYAATCAILIVAGLTHLVLLAFATVTAGWFCVTVAALTRSSIRYAGAAQGIERRSNRRGDPVETACGEGSLAKALPSGGPIARSSVALNTVTPRRLLASASRAPRRLWSAITMSSVVRNA